VNICRTCGHENVDDSSFCHICGSYLAWDDAPRAGTRADTEFPTGFQVSLILSDVNVVAGGETECQVKIRNNGRIVDQFTIEILGPTASWAEADPNTLELMPNNEGTARIRFRPPRSVDPLSGRIPFSVQVVSRADPGLVELIHSSLELEGS
jgi:hypothetical protein